MIIELFAFLLLNGDVSLGNVDYYEEKFLLKQVAVLAEQLDLLDKGVSDNETPELETLQKWWQELKDAPYADDAKRFPGWQVARSNCDWNRMYYSHLDALLPIYYSNIGKSEDIRAAKRQLDYLYKVWKAVEQSNLGYMPIRSRREALQELRSLIGEEAYYSGKLPSHVPLELMQSVR